ncbi:MAG: hypothetical protein K2Y01_01175 [Rhabdochlamydiaceae bacterium]|nr:hypothetical protein [Rhabdochlamydiaceae bacterium]
MNWYLFFLGIAICSLARASSNISLSASQQPNPLVGFGENIIDKGQVQLLLFTDAYIGQDTYYTDLIPGILYGIRDDLSLFFNIPFAPTNALESHRSSGLEDISLQPEYAFYSKDTPLYLMQATVVGNVTFPTGSSKKNPPTGFAAPSFFLGSTFSYTGVTWLFSACYGGVFPLKGSDMQFGNRFLYEAAFGRNIPSPTGWIFAWIIEGSGTYAGKNTIGHEKIPNSGGNTIYLIPSFWVSTKRTLLQIGAGYPIVQHLFGKQKTDYLYLSANFGVTF